MIITILFVFAIIKNLLAHIHNLLHENVIIGPSLTLEFHVVVGRQDALVYRHLSLRIIAQENVGVLRQAVQVCLLLSKHYCLVVHLMKSIFDRCAVFGVVSGGLVMLGRVIEVKRDRDCLASLLTHLLEVQGDLLAQYLKVFLPFSQSLIDLSLLHELRWWALSQLIVDPFLSFRIYLRKFELSINLGKVLQNDFRL